MTQLARLSTLVVLGVGLMACSANPSPSAEPGSDFVTVTPDTLTVATIIPYEGFMNGTDVDNVTGGLDYQLVKEIAARVGLSKLVFKNVDFAAVVAGQVTGYDIAVAQIYKTEERAQVNDYSDCYRRAYTTPIVGKGVEIAGVDDLRALTWGVQTGSDGEATLRKYVQTENFRSYPSITQVGADALRGGSIDGIFMGIEDVGSLFNDSYVRDNYTVPVRVVTDTNPEGSCIAVQLPKGSANVAAVNDALAAIMDEGLIREWEEEYLPYGDIDVESLPTITLATP